MGWPATSPGGGASGHEAPPCNGMIMAPLGSFGKPVPSGILGRNLGRNQLRGNGLRSALILTDPL